MKNPWLLWRTAHDIFPIGTVATVPKITGNLAYHVLGHYFGAELGPQVSQTDVYLMLEVYGASLPGQRLISRTILVPTLEVRGI